MNHESIVYSPNRSEIIANWMNATGVGALTLGMAITGAQTIDRIAAPQRLDTTDVIGAGAMATGIALAVPASRLIQKARRGAGQI